MLTRVDLTCYRGRVLLAWVAVAVGLFALGSAVASDYRMDFSLPDIEGTHAASPVGDPP